MDRENAPRRMVTTRLLVFEKIEEDPDSLIYRGWIREGDLLDDPAKYEFFPPPPDYAFDPSEHFSFPRTIN